MGLKETLALVITADVKGAVAGLEATGAAADKNLGKTDAGLERTGKKLTSTGAAMVGFGAVALVGLGHAAMASEEADKATLRLQSSIQNNPRLAGESTKAFEDLATSIMKKTAADDDDIISGEAVLAQMGLTGQQITDLTPLVVDLSRKMGVDMDTAAKTVAKSVNGSSGALKKMGIDVDATRFKTDAYGATMDALSNSVGGFAEQEGQTFSGQLERMGNELHNLEEGVGKGVVKAFGNLFQVVEKVTGALESLSPGAQGAIGEFATYGAVALTAVGALSALVGMLTTAAARFGISSAAKTADTVATQANTAAEIENTAAKAGAEEGGASLLGTLGPLAVGIGAVALAYKIGSDHAEEFAVDTQKVLAATTDQLVPLAQGAQALDKMGVSYQQQTDTIVAQSVPAAYKFIDALAAQGVNVDSLRASVDKHVTTEKQAQAATDEYTKAANASAEAEANLTAQVDAHRKAIEQQIGSMDTLIGSNISLDQAQLNTQDSLNKVIEAQGKANEAQGIDGLVAQEDLRKAVLDAAGAIDSQAQATAENTAKQDAANGHLDTAVEKNTNYMNALSLLAGSLSPDSPVRQYLQGYIDQLNSIPSTKTTRVSVVGPGGIPVAGKFADGGVVPGPKGSPQLILAHGGETVLPTHKDMGPAAVGAFDIPHGVTNYNTFYLDASNPQEVARKVADALATV